MIERFYHFFNDEQLQYRANDRFVREIVVNLVPRPFLENQQVIGYGEKVGEVYFIFKGSVTLYGHMLNVGISSLPKGSYFGEIPLMLKLLSSFVYRTGAKEETLLFSIKSECLSSILEEFPEERAVLVKRALKRRQYFKHIRDLKKLLLFKRYLKRLAKLERVGTVYADQLEFLTEFIRRVYGSKTREHILKKVEGEIQSVAEYNMEDLSDGEFDETGLRMKKTKLLKRAANTTLSDI